MKRILPLVLVLSAASTVLAANPTTTSISPSSTIAGSAQFTLTVNGTNFDSTSKVNWNGAALTTTFVSATQLTAIVPAANVAAPGTASVTVKNSTGSASNAQTFTINPRPPVINSSLTAAGTVGVAFSYQITATNNPTSYNATGLPAGLTVNTGTGLISGTPTTAGTYSVTISATNAGGTGSATLTLTVVNPPPPVITSSLTATGQVGVAFSYTIAASNNPTSFNATGLPAGLAVNTITGLISGTPTTAGTYTVTISATNSGGTGSATLTLTINPATPVIQPPFTATGQVGVAFSYQITATNNPTSFNATGLPAGLSVNTSTGLISGTPTTAGTYTVTISATNAGGTGSHTLTLTINPPTPVIQPPFTATGTVGVPFSYQITATNNPTSYNATVLPAGLSVNTSTGVISGTPTTAGTYSVTISATNAGGTGSATLVITINPAKPVITSSLTATGTVGVAFSYTITATNSPTSYGATGLPAGLSVNTSTGVISGTPTTAGTYSVTISATNVTGTGSATLVITINPAAPVITSPTTAAGNVCVAFSYQITATNNPTSYGATGLPAFLSVNTSTGLISGTPTATGTYPFTVSATNGGGTGTKTVTLTVGNPPPPAITSPLTATGTVGVAFSYTITASNCPTSYNATGLPSGLSVNTSTGVISGTPTTSGTYNVTISATNSGGTGTATLVITINNPVPTTTSLGPTCAPAGGADFTLTVNGTNFVSSSTVKWNGTSLVTTFVSSTQLTATVSASLIATAGTASITVVNPSPGGGSSNAQTFTIANTPVITSPLTATGTVGVAFSYTITATGNPTSYGVSPNPPTPGLSQGNGSNRNVISGTPTTAGTYNVTITASKGAGPCNTGSATLVITICPDAPSITSSLTASATLGTPFSYQITADNSPISYNANDLPGGLTVCHDSSEGCTPGLISGTPTALGVFPVTISATSANTGPCGSSTATDTLTLTVSLPGGVLIPPFPGQLNVFNWGSTKPPPDAQITFPNASTNNYFVLYWNAPGSNTNQAIADSANGGLQRNQDLVGMQLNQYTPPARPDPTKNVWRGSPLPPNDNTSGQFADPRASWYVTDPWPTADYVTRSYWAGPNPKMIPLNWPDSGHAFSYTGLQPTGKGQYPTDIMASPTPPPDPTKTISLLSTSTSGNLTSITELGNVWDPAQLSYTVVNPGGARPDIPTSATLSSRGAGGHTLAIGRPEFSMFDQNGMRAWQLLDVFSGKTSNTNFTNTAGLVNLNTASFDVLRSLAAGILQNADPAIVPLYPPTASTPTSSEDPSRSSGGQADLFAQAVINSRPLLSTAALSAISNSNGPFFGNWNQYNGTSQTPPTEWNDPGREELFAKIYNLATTRSRNFRVFVTGQALDKNGKVLSTVTKVYQVFIKPNRDPTTGAILSQQVVIKYEGSM